MKSGSKISGLLVMLCAFASLEAQFDSLRMEVETAITGGTGDNLPFWLQSNRYGSIANESWQGNVRAGIYDPVNAQRKISGYYGFSFVGGLHEGTRAYVEEWYGGLKLGFLRVEAGARKRVLRDYFHENGSGDLIWSANHRPIPEIILSTYEYVNIPFTRGWLQFNSGISHGWLRDDPGISQVLLHRKWIMFRTGEHLPLRLQAGMHHFAEWGGDSEALGEIPADFSTFKDVFMARSGGGNTPVSEQLNASGNHLGSYHMGAEYRFGEFRVEAYWQTLFEDNSGRTMRNFPDGLYAVGFRTEDKDHWVTSVVVEYIATDDQSGDILSDSTRENPPQGRDNYFNHHIYLMGWTQDNRTMGTPLITSPVYNDEPEGGIQNNRVRALHLGVSGRIEGIDYRFLFTHSLNKGSYDYPLDGYSRDHLFLLGLSKDNLFGKNTQVSLEFGMDLGNYYGDNFGVMVRWRKELAIKYLDD